MRVSITPMGFVILFGVLSLSCSNGKATRPASENASIPSSTATLGNQRPSNETAVSQEIKSDDPLTHSTVKLDPSKYAGRQVTWVGAVVSSTITSTGITNFWKVDGEDDDSVFATIQNDEQSTDAAKARDKIRFDFTRKVTGTISNEQGEYQRGMDAVRVPLLNKVVIDAPDKKAK